MEEKIINAVVQHKDITEIKRGEERLKSSLLEKEILLAEIHHRVKNNFQVITSMLHLQMDMLRDDYDRSLFIDACNRIQSMAMVHEKLYLSNNIEHIDFNDYIKSLANSLFAFYSVSSGNISLILDIVDERYIDARNYFQTILKKLDCYTGNKPEFIEQQ